MFAIWPVCSAVAGDLMSVVCPASRFLTTRLWNWFGRFFWKRIMNYKSTFRKSLILSNTFNYETGSGLWSWTLFQLRHIILPFVVVPALQTWKHWFVLFHKLELYTLPSISKNTERRIPNIRSWPTKCIFYVFMFNAMQLLHTAGNIDTDYRCQNIW